MGHEVLLVEHAIERRLRRDVLLLVGKERNDLSRREVAVLFRGRDRDDLLALLRRERMLRRRLRAGTPIVADV
jgi:hypothetical protein